MDPYILIFISFPGVFVNYFEFDIKFAGVGVNIDLWKSNICELLMFKVFTYINSYLMITTSIFLCLMPLIFVV